MNKLILVISFSHLLFSLAVGQNSCLQNINIPVNDSCQSTITSGMFTLPSANGHLVFADQNNVPSSVSTGTLTTQYTIYGEGNWNYGIYNITPDASGKHPLICSGTFRTEDKSPSVFSGKNYTQYGTFKEVHYSKWTGTLSGSDPNFRPSQWSCWQSTNHANLSYTWPNSSQRSYDIINIEPNFDGYMTIISKTSSFEPTVAVYSGEFNPENPCSNLLALGQSSLIPNPLAGLGVTSSQVFAPWLITNQPIVRMEVNVSSGTPYKILITHRNGNLGNYELYFMRNDFSGNIEIPGLSQEVSFAFFEFLCPDIPTVALNQTVQLNQNRYPGGSLKKFGAASLTALDNQWKTKASALLTPVSSTGSSIVDINSFNLNQGSLDQARIFLDSLTYQFGFLPLVVENCENWTVSISDQINSFGDCGGQITRSYRLPSGESSSVNMIFRNPTLHDVRLPHYTVHLDCNQPVHGGFPFIATLGGIIELTPQQTVCNIGASYDDSGNENQCGGNRIFRRNWTIYDYCRPGTTVIYHQLISVGGNQNSVPQPDQRGQVNFEISPLDCSVNLNVSKGTTKLQGDCGGGTISIEIKVYSNSSKTILVGQSSANQLNLSNLQMGNYYVVWTLTDECGRIGTYEQTVNATSNCIVTANLNGIISTSDKKGIGNVKTILKNAQGGTLKSTTTSNDGSFGFTQLETNKSYLLSLEKDDHPRDGISTLDIIQITQHILGNQLLSSPLALLAADVNQSGTITITDIIALRKLILGLSEKLGDSKSWIFVPEKYNFKNPQSPWKDSLLYDFNIEMDGSDVQEYNFMGIKMGDVDQTASIDIQPRESGNLNLFAEIIPIQEENIFRVDLKLEHDEIMGFQAELEWNSNADFIDLKSDIIKLENVNREKNTLKISWNGKIDQPKIASLFFRKYPEELKLKNNFLQSEAYTIDLKAVPLSFTSKNLNNKKIQFGPNPWTDQHMFIFDVNQKEEVTLEIMDGNGKILFRKNKPMMEGKHEWTVFQDEILGSGIFYFRLYSKSFSHSGKMLKL
jgi:hypothetical protein